MTRARFLDRDGDELGRQDVLTAEARRFNASNATGKSPDQADGSWWLLPQIKEGLAGF